ncbi:DBF4-type zinc finger-containing protein 2 isoform X2 [Megalops cyprinoides]|uniref:DBF4-type zinc finger-containing protein 2 isoform X2 n=1 Tax=Megalops cyprinoides TaxID=118141 RepID=UPI001863AE61|nr:DBF4-type zinc finger-containing protein 2 isoform X2 [Megalops cyprinoides]
MLQHSLLTNNKTMPAEEHSTPIAQVAERSQGQTRKLEQTNGNGVMEQAVPGPSSAPPRQGFCSCCQVLYTSVEQHITSTRHREVVSNARTQAASSSLMERFLQDVIQHHPHLYNDTRPTHADLPSLSSPLVPREELSEIYCAPEDDRETVGTREEMPSSDEESCHLVIVEDVRSPPPVDPQARRTTPPQAEKSNSSGKARVASSVDPPSVDKGSPTQDFLHRTSNGCALASPVSAAPLLAEPCSSQAPPPSKSGSPQAPPPGQPSSPQVQLHRKAHRKTDRPGTKSRSPLKTSPASKGVTSGDETPIEPEVKSPTVWIPAKAPPQSTLRDRSPSSRNSNKMSSVIEEVIEKYCYGRSPKRKKVDEESFHLSLHSITDPDFSDDEMSEEWDTPVRTALETAKAEVKDLGCLTEAHVNVEDQIYRTQLDTALNLQLQAEAAEGKKADNVKADKRKIEEVLPALPHIPQSFIGKTWSQVMYEDDLKIESMVRDFREGRFRCYFESESLATYGMRSKEVKGQEDQVEKEQWDQAGLLPVMDRPEDDTLCDRDLERRAGRRTWRLASRCQVVKVSHSTQTNPLNSPMVRNRVLDKASTSLDDLEQQHDLTKTPDMKTRLCALKLPDSYTKIASPLQAKTVVYVLASPDSGQGFSKPIRRVGRKPKYSDGESASKFKYKKTPLKYYDPLTNRILKAPPKGVAVGKPKPFPYVRQLFRSLSPDINMEKQFVEQKDAWSSSKGRGGSSSSVVDFGSSTSGSCLESSNASESGSSVSSRRALFSRSSLSSSSRFLLGTLTSSPSHADSTTRVLAAEPDRTVQTQGSRGQAQGRQGLQTECLKEKPLGPAKGPASPYRSRKVRTRLMPKKGQARSNFPVKLYSTRKSRSPRLSDHRKELSPDFLARTKTRSPPQPEDPPQKEKVRKTYARAKGSVRSPSKSPVMEKQGCSTLTRTSSRHPASPLMTRILRKRGKT